MKTEKCAAPSVFTDIPTQVSFPKYGASTTDKPCTIVTTWQTELQHFPNQMGSLAVRWTRNGQRSFQSDRELFAVDDNSYLIFNGGRESSSSVESSTLVSCYSISFAPCVAEDALRAMVTAEDRLLEDPHNQQFQPVQ